MAERYLAVFKCRGCGAVLKDEELTQKTVNPRILDMMFEDDEHDTSILYSTSVDDGCGHLIHRCDHSRNSMCDFVGWERMEVQKDD